MEITEEELIIEISKYTDKLFIAGMVFGAILTMVLSFMLEVCY